jgi:hypothetical protein
MLKALPKKKTFISKKFACINEKNWQGIKPTNLKAEVNLVITSYLLLLKIYSTGWRW